MEGPPSAGWGLSGRALRGLRRLLPSEMLGRTLRRQKHIRGKGESRERRAVAIGQERGAGFGKSNSEGQTWTHSLGAEESVS